jgi:putative oxidoreductase
MSLPLKPTDIIRYLTSYIFLLEGALKWINTDASILFFITLGIPYPTMMVLLVGTIEVVCGSMLLFNVYISRAVTPLLFVMIVAISLTKIPIFLDYGFLAFAHESRLDVIMIILLFVLWRENKSSLHV